MLALPIILILVIVLCALNLLVTETDPSRIGLLLSTSH
jgi:hypothetical protein